MEEFINIATELKTLAETIVLRRVEIEQSIPDIKTEILDRLTRDADIVRAQLDNFVKCFMEEDFDSMEEECPYFATIWFGDMYDESEFNGLKCLYGELQKQLADIESVFR